MGKPQLDIDIENIYKHNKDIYVNILDYDGKANDNTFDNTIALQNALNYLESIGGGVVKIPTGLFYFKGTITVPAYCSIEGVPCVARSESKGSVLIHNSNTSNLTFIQFMSYDSYCYGNTFKNLTIKGNGATGIVIDLNKTSYTTIENVTIEYGGTSLKINGGMLNNFRNVSMVYYREYGLLIKNTNLSTTQRFYDCYIGQTTFSTTAIPMKIETSALTDCTFNTLTVESTEKGIYINMQNNITINNIYIENICPTQVGSIFNVGILEEGEVIPNSGYFKGILNINGGFIQGSALSNSTSGKNIFNIDVIDTLNVENIKYNGFNRTIAFTTNNVSRLYFKNCVGTGVGNDLNIITTERFTIVNCIISGSVFNYDDSTIFKSRGSVVGTDNLNDTTFHKSGTWFYYSNGTTANNFPYVSSNGMLIVYYHPVSTSDGFISQTFRGTDNSYWHRFSTNRGTSWSTWKQQTT